MKASHPTAIEIERATEQIRQERETFDQQKSHSERWFKLRLTMGYSSVALLAAVMSISGYVLFHASAFPSSVLTLAGSALFVDVLGLLVGVWRISMNPKLISQLEPVTNGRLTKTKKPTGKSGQNRSAVSIPESANPLFRSRLAKKTERE